MTMEMKKDFLKDAVTGVMHRMSTYIKAGGSAGLTGCPGPG